MDPIPSNAERTPSMKRGAPMGTGVTKAARATTDVPCITATMPLGLPLIAGLATLPVTPRRRYAKPLVSG